MMHFNSMQEAIRYVAEMSVEHTEEIGDAEVWRGADGSIVIDDRGDLVWDDDEDVEYEMIGTVAERLY